MKYVHQIETWTEGHQVKWLAILRIILGLTIFTKGLFFIMDTDALLTMIGNSASDLYSVMLVHLVASAHLVGGILIVIGLVTRLAVIFQIPILLGAIFFVNAISGFFSMQSELSLSIVVLTLLIFFLFFGSGKFSVDDWMRRNSSKEH